MAKHKTAACGIDCGECGHHMLAMDNSLKSAERLVEYFRDGGWIRNNDGTEAVLKKVPICGGCREKTNIRTDYCANCFLRACCEEKRLNHCGECDGFPWEKYMEFVGDHDHHKKTMEYLLSLKQASRRERS